MRAFLWACTVAVLASCVLAAVRHSHHHHREREADGTYSTRNKHHFDPDGHHDSHFDHEAIVGSHKEAKEYEHLPPEEAKQRLGELAKLMDKDHDGYVTDVELRQWIERSFRRMSLEESDDRFNETDTDHDDRVTWKEILYETYEVRDEKDIPIDDTEELQLVAEDRVMFVAADENGDGFLSRVEFLSYSHPEEVPRMGTAMVNNTLLERDRDADGFINLKEFLNSGKEDADSLLHEGEDRFNEYDRNNDGRLDHDEIIAWMQPSNEHIAREETTHLLSTTDDDNDGRLSMQEIVQHHDVFVGSEATDYGDHLHNLEDLHDEL